MPTRIEMCSGMKPLTARSNMPNVKQAKLADQKSMPLNRFLTCRQSIARTIDPRRLFKTVIKTTERTSMDKLWLLPIG